MCRYDDFKFSKRNTCFKNKCLLEVNMKVYGNLMDMNHGMSLGILVLHDSQKGAWLQKHTFLGIHQKYNSAIAAKSKKVCVYPMVSWNPEAGDTNYPSGKYLYSQ